METPVHLVVTSPPYWNLKRYNENPDRLGHVENYETFLSEQMVEAGRLKIKMIEFKKEFYCRECGLLEHGAAPDGNSAMLHCCR